jgi:hypothetical protein
LKFLNLDLLSSFDFYTTRSSPTGSPTSPASTDGLRFFHRRLLPSTWLARSRVFFALASAWPLRLLPQPPTTSAIGGSGRNRRFLLLRGLPSAAHVLHAPSQMAPPPPPSTGLLMLLLFVCLFICFIGLICCIPLPHFTSIFVFGSL